MVSKESVMAFMMSERYKEGKGCSEKYQFIMEGFSSLESNLKKLRDSKREAKEVFDGQGHNEVQLDLLRRYYLHEIKKHQEILTVNDLRSLFDIGSRFILELLHSKKIRSAKVDGKYLTPQKCVMAFLEGAHFSTMVQLHQHLWARMDTPTVITHDKSKSV